MADRRPIVGFESSYEVSVEGDVFSVARTLPARGGSSRHIDERKLPSRLNAGGYVLVSLNKDKRTTTHYVHRLVLEAFVGPCPADHECRHLDANKANNRLENLAWGAQRAPDEESHASPGRQEGARNKAKTWRKEPRNQAGGTAWRLLCGRADERIRLHLGFVTEADAQRALDRIQAEEEGGTVRRVLALHKQDEEGAIAYLMGDPGEDILLPEAPIDYAGMTLREYQREVYAPWRKEDTAAWRSEGGFWKRILRELGSLKLRNVDAHVVADYLDAMMLERGKRQGLPVSGNTKRLHRAALQALLCRAERLKHIEAAPDLARFRIKGSTKSTMERVDPLSIDELTALMDASSPKHRAMWAVGGGEGLRPSELLRMRWEDVRWPTRTLIVRGTKTGEAAAEIPLTPIAHRELQSWWMQQGQPTEGVVFPSKGEEGYLAESGYKRSLATAARNATIGRPVTPYLLRHSFATIAWSVGVEKDVARRVMRHTNEDMLDEVYCRPRPADLVARVAAFDRRTPVLPLALDHVEPSATDQSCP